MSVVLHVRRPIQAFLDTFRHGYLAAGLQTSGTIRKKLTRRQIGECHSIGNR